MHTNELISSSDTKRYELPLTMLVAMLAFAVAFLCVGMGPGQKHIFLSGDLYLEYAAVNRLFWRNLLQGNSLVYSFSMGMGMPALSTFAYDCFSPVHILFAMISDADLAAFLVVMIKIGCSAGTFYSYARNSLRAERYLASALGICYSMCGYVIGSVCHIAFMDAVYMLPVLVMLLKRAVKNERYILLTPAYAYCFVTMFYTGYMLGLFTAVIYVSILAVQRDLSGKERIRHILHYVLAAGNAVLLSAMVTLPTALFIFANQAEDATAWHRPDFHIWDLAGNLFLGQFQGYNGQVPLVYCGVGVLLTLLVGGGAIRNDKHRYLVGVFPLIFLLLCIFIKPFYLMIHAFDMPDTFLFRFSYMLSFLALSAAACIFPRTQSRKKWLIVALGLAGGYFALYFIEKFVNAENMNGMAPEAGVLNAVFLILWAILLSITKKNAGRRIALILLAGLEMSVNAFLMHHPDEDAYSRSREFYELWNQEGTAVAEGLAQDTTDAGAFRVYYENVMFLNDAAYFGYHGLGYFYSAEQPAVRHALSGLGYATSARSVCDYGSTPVTTMLFAQRYLVHGTDLRYETPDAFSVQKNDYALPMAYMVSEDLLRYSAGDDPFANQDQLLALMRGEEGNRVYRPIEGEITRNENGIRLSETDSGFHLAKEENVDTGYIAYHVPEQEGRPVFAYFDPVIKGWWHDSTYLFSPRTDIGGLGWEPLLSLAHIMPLGQEENGEAEAIINMTPATTHEQDYKQAFFASFDTTAFLEAFSALHTGAAEITDFADGYMRCVAEASEQKPLLFTGIPNDPGWEVLVDGVKTEVLTVVNDAFLAVPLKEGRHEIVMRYHMPGQRIGLGLSVLGLVLLLGQGIRIKQNSRKKCKLLKQTAEEA